MNQAAQKPMMEDVFGLNEMFSEIVGSLYENGTLSRPRGLTEDGYAYVNSLNPKHSAVNKIHTITLSNKIPADEIRMGLAADKFKVTKCYELCTIPKPRAGYEYDVEDFLYCKNLGMPVNRMITLRRFSYPISDNIITNKNVQSDMGRMVTFMSEDSNKLEDITTFSYGLKWKQLTAEYEQASMLGGSQSGLNGMIKGIGALLDPTMMRNALSGASSGGPMSEYNPLHDQNRVYGPVDSITETHIRDVGFEFDYELSLQFDYVARSIGGKSAAYAMKDIIGNILFVTMNNGKFWGGARYWVGEQPSPWAAKLQWMNSGNIDDVLAGAKRTMTAILANFKTVESSLEFLKSILKGGLNMMLSKFLDTLGRPGIPVMNSLLSSAPVGVWHVTIGNPLNPIISMGNLLLDSTEFKFTGDMTLGDIPSEISVICKLKPGMPRDRAAIETMLNGGTSRLYWRPNKIKLDSAESKKINRTYRRQILGRDGVSSYNGKEPDAAKLTPSIVDKRKYQDIYDFQQESDNVDASIDRVTYDTNTDNKKISISSQVSTVSKTIAAPEVELNNTEFEDISKNSNFSNLDI